MDIIDFLPMYDPNGASRKDSTPSGKSDREGFLTLHLAYLENHSLKNIKHLFDAYPDAIFTRTRAGNLPVDMAIDLYDNGSRRKY